LGEIQKIYAASGAMLGAERGRGVRAFPFALAIVPSSSLSTSLNFISPHRCTHIHDQMKREVLSLLLVLPLVLLDQADAQGRICSAVSELTEQKVA
jgi:hypothetical protein